MPRLWRYVRRYRWRYVGGIFCLLATTSLTMCVPYLFKQVVDGIAADAPLRTTVDLLLLVIGISLCQAVARTYSRFVIFNAGRDIEYDLRNDLFGHLERLPVAFYQARSTGEHPGYGDSLSLST